MVDGQEAAEATESSCPLILFPPVQLWGSLVTSPLAHSRVDVRHAMHYTLGMIKTFADARTRELYVLGKAKRFPADVARRAARKLEYVDLA